MSLALETSTNCENLEELHFLYAIYSYRTTRLLSLASFLHLLEKRTNNLVKYYFRTCKHSSQWFTCYYKYTAAKSKVRTVFETATNCFSPSSFCWRLLCCSLPWWWWEYFNCVILKRSELAIIYFREPEARSGPPLRISNDPDSYSTADHDCFHILLKIETIILGYFYKQTLLLYTYKIQITIVSILKVQPNVQNLKIGNGRNLQMVCLASW